jgi:hypothetical protein
MYALTTSVPEIDPAGVGSVVAFVVGCLGLIERRHPTRGRAQGTHPHLLALHGEQPGWYKVGSSVSPRGGQGSQRRRRFRTSRGGQGRSHADIRSVSRRPLFPVNDPREALTRRQPAPRLKTAVGVGGMEGLRSARPLVRQAGAVIHRSASRSDTSGRACQAGRGRRTGSTMQQHAIWLSPVLMLAPMLRLWYAHNLGSQR